MKSLATSVIVLLVIGVLVLGLLGYFFFIGVNPGEKQISREKARAECMSLCSEDQEKIYQLSGHPGKLDLPDEKYGIMYLKPTSFCSKKLNVKNEGKVFCDQLVTCRVKDGDGDVGYLHCSDNVQVSGGGGGSGGGSSGGAVIKGPLAQGVPIGENVMVCDGKGEYIKFFVKTNKPLVGSKVRVWGIVCNNSNPVVNQKVYFKWNNYPLSEKLYYMNFENLTGNNELDGKYLKGWDFNETFWGNANNSWCNQHLKDCATVSPGYLSIYMTRLYMDTHKNLFYRSINFTNPYEDADEVDAFIYAAGGVSSYVNCSGKLELSRWAGEIPEVTLILSNGTNEKYVHYYFGVGCTPGKYYYSYNCTQKEFDITLDDCSKMLTSGNGEKINNVTFPDNDPNNIYINVGPKLGEYFRFSWKEVIPKSWLNYSLKKIRFGIHVLGGTGGTGPEILLDNFKIIKYKDMTKTNQFGMFNTTIDTPLKMGEYNLTASTIGGISATGALNIYPKPTINISSQIIKNQTSIKINGMVTYLNGTPINNSKVWIIIDGKPYSNRHVWINYTFDNEGELNDWELGKSTPAYSSSKELVNGVMNVSTHSKWGVSDYVYYWFNPEEYVDNITFFIKPYIRSYPNYTLYLQLTVDDNGVEKNYYKYVIGKTGYRDIFGRTMGIWRQPRIYNFNATNDTWTTITFNPYNFTLINNRGKTYTSNILSNEKQKLVVVKIGEASGGRSNRDDFLLDNVSFRTVGNLLTDENGRFSLSIPKSDLGSGNHILKIEAIGTLGEEAYVIRSFN